MPTRETLEKFIARVELNAHAEAIEEFYAPDASMQENGDHVVVRWVLEWLDGKRSRMEERFFYDPAQLEPK